MKAGVGMKISEKVDFRKSVLPEIMIQEKLWGGGMHSSTLSKLGMEVKFLTKKLQHTSYLMGTAEYFFT